jgi:hypothetical protein
LRPGIAPQSVTVFHDDDHRPFFHWLDQNNEDGYFLNTRPNPTTTVPMLHRARCEHIGRLASQTYTNGRVKLCSLSRPDLEQWAIDAASEKPTLCRTCYG